MTYNEHDPMLPRGTDKCRCPSCGEYFNTTYAFDQHRKGKLGTPERRCLSVLEMSSSRWTQKPSGHWLSPRRGAYDHHS